MSAQTLAHETIINTNTLYANALFRILGIGTCMLLCSRAQVARVLASRLLARELATSWWLNEGLEAREEYWCHEVI